MQTLDQPEPGARSPRNASCDIDVRLDHPERTLTGRETVQWRNASRQPTSELQFHLYRNAWRDAETTWPRARRLAGNRTPPLDDGWSAVELWLLEFHDDGHFQCAGTRARDR